MNRLRGRKKAKEEPMPRPSVDSETSGPFKMFGRSKKPAEEPKKEVDLASALPASDDFRTSLLMTGLSARFSMLREQDDPSSKLGKASDDSVLFPKRQSRMDFGLGSGLHDIAEDASIRTPPFARMDSYQSSDDTASMTGSVMNRGKPTEGNNLFGGRQKIYKINAGGTSGRTLYDDDVAQSSFQKWRASEKERPSFDDGQSRYDTLRPESPPDFSRRRETSSTTSSAPSAGRNSTAATSVVSQPPSSLKDWQPPSASTPNSATTSQFPERSVTRTRRLYEQGLTQELENSQTSAKSRFDGLSKGRFSGRSGDLPHNSSSPTSINAPERSSERRTPIMSKASAPNLRSFSPPTSGSAQASPAESSSRFPNMDKTAQTTSPPLSPPISETEDYPMLSIGANDHGKATAMGFFNRPVQQYDENRYAQRQRQLQQGRETPSSRYRPESSGSVPTTRSRSSSSLNRTPFDRADSAVKPEPTVREEPPPSATFLDIDDDEDEAPAPLRSASGGQAPQVTLARPDDQEHPAFRQSALPTPLSLSSRTSEDGNGKPAESPEDSPTLGPGSGLSGMVRQHLRNASTASSNYGPGPQDDDVDDHYNPSSANTMDLAMGSDSNPWGDDAGHHQPEEPVRGRDAEPTPVNGRETDEFARHLADGAKRVRDRLTTYVESDQSRSTSPAAPLPPTEDELPPPRTSAFSVLRSKSSRGSLASRSRERSERRRSRPAKGLGLKTTDPSSPPSRPSVDEAPRKQSGERTPEKDENAHAGLKAFRQARRELQRMKEQEVRQRRGNQIPSAPTSAPPPPPPQARERSSGQSQDRGPPPVMYNRMPSGESGSRAPSERERSGSEASNGGQPHYRPRLRTGSSAYDDQRPHSPGYHQMHSAGSGRSPMMPPYSSHSDVPPGGGSRPGSRPGSAAGHFPTTNSTPNLPTSVSVPPPLPPINPRRKGMGSPLPRDEDMPGSGRMMSPDKARSAKGQMLMSDDEKGVSQYRQRLRKVTSEGSGIASRSRPPPPPPQSTMPDTNQPGGMF